MTFLTPLRVLTAAVGLTAAVAAVTTLFGDIRGGRPAPNPTDPAARPDGARVTDELARTKFSTQPVVTYQLHGGDTLFAWQVKPALAAAPARPRDVAVVVDTSASQAGRPLQQAKAIVQAVAAAAGPDDRFSVWVVSTPKATRQLTKDFVAGSADELRNAAAALTEVEYGSGATDLKNGLSKALDTFSHNRGRQQVVLFLGDGESAFAPVTEADRVALGGRMDQDDVFFFAVPLGLKVNPNNLHGFAAMTGGAVVRLQEDLGSGTKRAEFVARLTAALDAPVLKADKVTFGAEVAEVFPTKLPPLRADRPTLVLGKLTRPVASLTAGVVGKVSHRPVEVTLSQPIAPASPENYFLNVMLEQWRGAPHKEAPAVLQADRALALASTQVKLYRDEFLTQAVWAVTMDRHEEAAKMYAAVRRIDPNDQEAASGLRMIDQLKAGRVTRAELARKAGEKADALKIDKNAAVRMVLQEAAAQPAPAAGNPALPPVPSAGTPEAELLRQAQARQRVEEENYRVLVDAAIRRARELLRRDPDAAYEALGRMTEDVKAYTDLSPRVRDELLANLAAQSRDIFTRGAELKRQAAAEREQIARARQRLNEFDRQTILEDQTKARIEAFRQLMQQARYELAYQEAQLMIQERISRGLVVPPQATASYIIGQQATHLREWRELVRIREDRYLLAMMQTEKSHIPYPDEPPVHFPPAAVWRELTGQRRDRYTEVSLGAEASPTQIKLRSLLENQRVVLGDKFADITTVPLIEILQTLSKQYDVTFVISDGGDATVRERKPVLSATRLDGLTLGAYLDVVLESMQLTYIVRPDYIEVCSFDKRLTEKVTRAFPVADLVVPIPQAPQLQSVFQSLAIQNATLANYGAATIAGGGLVNLGAGGIGVGIGIGGLNPLAAGGGMALGAPGGAQGMLIMGQPGNNLGVQGGGVAGVGGGQLGQYGNLGGQFGFQGGTQAADILIPLIQQTVARGEWAAGPQAQQQPAVAAEPEPVVVPVNQLNSLSFHPPSLSLIVRGTSRYHGFGSRKLIKPDQMAAAPANNRPGGNVVVIGPGGVQNPNNPPAKAPAANPNPAVVAKAPAAPAKAEPVAAAPTIKDPKVNVQKVLAAIDKTDPKKMWQQAIDMAVDEPGLIVACADFLMDFDEPAHAAEILKANLRKGLATDAWAHEALAVALQSSQASPAESERAALSAIDLNPTDPKGYLRAAKAEDELKNHDQAVAFCKRAADLSPDLPGAYANALVYAERAGDVKADVVHWAANNLLSRDWPLDGVEYHKEARDRAGRIAAKLEAAGKQPDAAPIRKAIAENVERDLVIEVSWQGVADLDISVTEPSGAVASPSHKWTVGGGVVRTAFDRVATREDAGDDSRTGVYSAAKAFSGTYTVAVKKRFGNPVGNTATLKVTKFKGTPKEAHDLFTVDLSAPQPVAVKLEGGSRTELAAVAEEADEARLSTTNAPLAGGRAGIGGGAGSAISAHSGAAERTVALPVVLPGASESVLPGMTGGAADMRTAMKVNPDRQTMTVTMKPVFATGTKAVPLPKVPLLPGAEK